MTSPPATAIAWPVIDAAPGPASQRTASATSSGATSRAIGLFFASAARASSALRPVLAVMLEMLAAVISVSAKPGQTALTVTPVFAVSSASERIRPRTACLVAAVGAGVGVSLERGGAGDGDDAAEAGLRHPRQDELDGVENALDVDGEHAAERLGVGLADRRRLRNAGGGDQHGDWSEGDLGGANGPGERRRVRHIGSEAAGLAQGCGSLVQRRGTAADQRDGMRRRHRGCDSAADARPPASD